MNNKFSESFLVANQGANDEGVLALRQRLRETNDTDAQLVLMLTNRAQLEDDYGRRLLKLSKLNLGETEIGSTRNVLDTTKLEIEKTALAHIGLAEEIKAQLVHPLNDFINHQTPIRTNNKEAIKKAVKDRELATSLAAKAQDKYNIRCKEAETLALNRQHMSGKELEKHDVKVRKASALAQDAEKEYRISVAKAQEAYDKWQTIMKAGCDKIQETEESRLNQIKAVMMNYANLISSCSSADLGSIENVRKCLEHCSLAKDINLLLEVRGTGSEVPMRSKYSQYNAVSIKTIDSSMLASPTSSGSGEIERKKTTFEDESPEISPNREIMYQTPSMEENLNLATFTDLHLQNKPEESTEHISMESFVSTRTSQ